MIDLNKSRFPTRYEVTVGHQRVQVTGMSREDAIEEARRELSANLPRLYDLIQQLDDSRFAVQVIES